MSSNFLLALQITGIGMGLVFGAIIWRRRFGTLQPADVKRLRELETENAKLKRMVAEREMAIETLKEINRRKW